MMRDRSNQQGYTLVEALIVVGIIGIVSMVTIPNFISLYRSSKIKGASRQFVQDLRTARQTSVTEYKPMKISFETGVGKGSYTLWEGEFDSSKTDGIAWTEVWTKDMDETVYFLGTDFKDSKDDSNDAIDIVFISNGKIEWTTDHVNSTTAEAQGVTIKTELDVPRDSYEATITRNGRIRLP